jgi:hypothetical protein
MVEVRPDITSQWTKTVFIDDMQLRLQCPEDPIIEGDIVIVKCLTDKQLSNPLDPNTVPYQVKPYVKMIEQSGVNKGREIAILYLKLNA